MASRDDGLGEALDALDAVDAVLDALPRGALSLAPGRVRVTTLRVLVTTATAPGPACARLARSLARIARAEIECFPNNLFWDFDALAGGLAELAEDEDRLEQVTAIVQDLMEVYGERSALRFRYVHDFVYGFDWARWVRRGAPERVGLGPFSLPFLLHSQRRGRELLARIAEGTDPLYPPLPPGDYRNVFGFSREPSEERRLLADLAVHDLVPVRAWLLDPRPVWDRPFADLRETRARELGLPSHG